MIPGLIPVEALRARIDAYPELREVRGKRILDVGAASGWNSFELERRGAEVVAIDCVAYDEFLIAKRLLDSKVDYRVMDVDEISVEALGLFDYVLFFGVLYHLRHPLLALEKMCALTRDAAFVESYVIDAAPDPANCTLEFYETNELGGQIDNWFGPSTQCLLAMCRSAGFARATLTYNADRRAGVTCFRRWPVGEGVGEAPLLTFAINNRHEDAYFSQNKDEYICIHFHSREALRTDEVYVEIDEWGVPPLTLSQTGPGAWQVNVRVLPDLAPGRHAVRVRTAHSRASNAAPIVYLRAGEERPAPVAADLGSEDGALPAAQLLSIENTIDGGSVFRGHRNERMNCVFRVPDPELEARGVEVRIDERPQPILAAGPWPRGSWLLTLALPADLAAGEHRVRVRTPESRMSNAVTFTYVPERGW